MQEYRDFMLARSLGDETVTQRLMFARARLADWGSWEVDGATVAAWLNGHSGWTKLTYYNHLRSLYAWLVEDGLVGHDPMQHIKRPPPPKSRPRPLTEAEMVLALRTATGNVRSYLMLGYLAGLRRFEIAKVRGEDVTKHGIRVVGKGGQDWTVPTHPLLWELAQQYPREGWWFPSPWTAKRGGMHVSPTSVGNSVGLLFRSLGLEGATHRCRHSYGTQLLRGGANLRVVQELMRHGSLATTAGYLGVDEDEKASAIGGLLAA